ncbi:NAD(P)-dependent oxidoreductase, partial [Bacillus altitudinis]|uniref:NAD(P)-dependent oxidoreductase n=1 Tax=Bacillus altitudinis TaxID=293387 RepID=UPI003B517BA1
PLTHHTYHIIPQPQFKLINPTPLFLTISHPKTLHHKTLIQALHQPSIKPPPLHLYHQQPLHQHHPFKHMHNLTLA